MAIVINGDGTITGVSAGGLPDASVVTADILDANVTTAKIANDAVTGAKLNPSLVAGDVIYADGTDTITRLAKGTAAQVLTMNGGATAPSWADAAGGGALEYIATYTITGNPSTAGFSSGIDATRRVYVIYFNDVDISADADILGEWNMGGWSGNSAHGWAGGGNNGATIDRPYGSGAVKLSHAVVDSTNATSPINGHIYFGSNLASYRPACWGQMIASKADTSPGYHHFGGSATNTGVVTGFRLSLSTGTFTTGTLNLYGVKTS
jgi:hypothetical protein